MKPKILPPLFRVFYTYDENPNRQPRMYTTTVNAETAEAAITALRARMVADGMPMDRIEITGAALNVLT